VSGSYSGLMRLSALLSANALYTCFPLCLLLVSPRLPLPPHQRTYRVGMRVRFHSKSHRCLLDDMDRTKMTSSMLSGCNPMLGSPHTSEGLVSAPIPDAIRAHWVSRALHSACSCIQCRECCISLLQLLTFRYPDLLAACPDLSASILTRATPILTFCVSFPAVCVRCRLAASGRRRTTALTSRNSRSTSATSPARS
jgi:hypothetical protein